MWGRFVQYEGMAIYIEELNPQIELFSGYDAEPINRFNIAPRRSLHAIRQWSSLRTLGQISRPFVQP